ncbi:MAG: aminotransferase class IV [Balneolales bacterium]
MPNKEYSIQDGQVVRTVEAVIPATSSAASYGDGCFETLRSYSGIFLAFGRHMDRLKSSMRYLGMTIPRHFTQSYFEEETARLLKLNSLEKTDARIRLQIWRLGALGYRTIETDTISFLLTASPIRQNKGPVRLASVDQLRIPSAALQSRYKLSNGLNYILARREAGSRGYDDALMLDYRDHISETTIANIFWKRGDVVYTPSDHCDLLPGITRELQLEWLHKKKEISVQVGQFGLGQLLQAEAVWLTNSVQEVMPVSEINDTSFGTGDPLLAELKEAYREMIDHA